ncbi:hypothetical protein CDEST_09377 [Colletotrichum destructivum]|uniref:Uncharacterized protein n=1 Tax=Colletotrichum destructivum TaxID=34406 RepID=A0AAX4ILC3_9PEZI|nr:hypothetical protein CDEST_09377 [Colletotrichum destructivum]
MSQQAQKGVMARLSAAKDWYQLASPSPSSTRYNATTFDLRVCLEPKFIAAIQGSYCYSPMRRITVTVAATHLARDTTLANTDASMQEDGCTSARSSSCLTGPANSVDSTRALLFMASSSHRRESQSTGTRSPGLVQPAIAGAAGRRRAGLRQGNYCSPSSLSREKNPTASLAGSTAGCQAKVSGPVTATSDPDDPDDPGFLQRLQQWDGITHRSCDDHSK